MSRLRPRAAKRDTVVVDLRDGGVTFTIRNRAGHKVSVTPSLSMSRPEPCPTGSSLLARMARTLGGYATTPTEDVPTELNDAAKAAGADGKAWREHFRDCPLCLQTWAWDGLKHVTREMQRV